VPVQTLDCTQLRCPIPIVRISQMVKEMAAGDRLQIQASDPAFKADLEAWLRRLGHRLVEFQDGPVQRAVIEKRGLDAGD
jgi:tRNA 2-thiouridine synthesizing protein A